MAGKDEIPKDSAPIGLLHRREANLTMPWFVEKAKYPARNANVIEPLVNGERTFKAVSEAIANAKKTVDIISWGFDPSMRLVRPGGERVGELLRRISDHQVRRGDDFSKPNVQVRVLIWKNALANLGENNLVGDGLLGSGGGTALGSGVGGMESAGGGSSGENAEFNDYAAKRSNSAAVQSGDDDAKRFNREWFRYQPPSMEFRTRDFSLADRTSIARQQIAQRGLANPGRTYLMTDFASHHQKMILVDYELPEHAVGFVMGHNLLRSYWDTDAHEYASALRDGFAPWQDLSCRVRGPVLFDLNENFVKAWDKAEGSGSKMFWSDARKARKAEDFASHAVKHGAGEMAQICRTQPQEGDLSILASYQLALANARNYLYFENQYFRYKDFAELLRSTRRKLKSAGWKRDFFIFTVTNVPDGSGRLNTYEMLDALGKGKLMPGVHTESSPRDPEAALRKADLEGVNIHLATLCASGQSAQGTKYKDIYVHSKLLLVDDVFFTLGSANVNVRSMEGDSELNIACPSPGLTQQWRKHLWRLHTGATPGDDPAQEFGQWEKLLDSNSREKKLGKPLTSSLIEFFDSDSSTFAPD
jgi:phosphatidylserine/phosphatidylglycerophosphate/cardiolipin synthase-like enzyme